MAHGCIRCSRCGGACPLCGSCACGPTQLAETHRPYELLIADPLPRHDFLQAFRHIAEEQAPVEEEEPQRPETD